MSLQTVPLSRRRPVTWQWMPRRGKHHTASAVLTGLVVGIAVWGRGNSLPVVGLVVLWPGLLALWVAWRSRAAVLWMDLVIAGAIAALIAGEFYIQYWTILLKYYGVHASYVEAHRWSYAGARQFILNVPGFMYWRAEDSPLCIGLTFASHLFVVLALAASWWPGNPLRAPRFFRFRQLVTGGAFIYFGTYLVDMILFANDQPGFSIYQSLLVWRPMLIGLSLILTAIAAEILRSFPFKFESFAAAAIALAALAWGFIWTQVFTPSNQSQSWPSPQVVERFALNLDRLADNSPVAVLWYHGWNEPILNYYRLANDLPPANFFTGGQSKYDHFVNALPPVTWLHPLQYYHRVMNDWRAARRLNVEHHDAMWSLSDYSEENRARALEQVKYQFTHASLIILPEYLDQYKSDEPYAFYKFKEDWAAWLSSEEAPRFRVVMLLHETPSERLLVIRREDIAPRRGRSAAASLWRAACIIAPGLFRRRHARSLTRAARLSVVEPTRGGQIAKKPEDEIVCAAVRSRRRRGKGFETLCAVFGTFLPLFSSIAIFGRNG